MNNAIALAQFWGWLTLIVSGTFFARPDVLRDVKILMIENRAFSLSYGLSLILGLASVILYNDWTLSWQVVVSLFGWLALLKGILVLGWPEISKSRRSRQDCSRRASRSSWSACLRSSRSSSAGGKPCF